MQEKPDLRIAAVFGVAAGFIIAVGNLYWQLEQTKTEMANLRQSILTEVTKLSEAAQQAAKKKTPAATVAEPSPKAMESLKAQITEELASNTKRVANAAST